MNGRFPPLVRCPGVDGSRCETLIDPSRRLCGECARGLEQYDRDRLAQARDGENVEGSRRAA